MRIKPGLHLIRDVERVVALAQPLDGLQVAGLGEREPVGRGDRLDDHPGDVTAAQRRLHRVEVVEWNLDELLGPVGQEQGGEAIVAGRHREAGVAVVALQDRDDLAPLAGVAGGLDRDVDCLAAARSVHDAAEVRRAGGDERLGQRGAGQRREVVVADVEAAHRLLERGDQLGVAMAEVVRAAVEVQVDQTPPRHVPEQIACAPIDHEVDAGVLPEPCLVRVPELLGPAKEVRLRLVGEEAVVVHGLTEAPLGAARPYHFTPIISRPFRLKGPQGP